MGLPGLRHAKEALKPHHMSEMYNAWFPEDKEELLNMGLIGNQLEERLQKEASGEENPSASMSEDPLRTAEDKIRKDAEFQEHREEKQFQDHECGQLVPDASGVCSHCAAEWTCSLVHTA